jgi:hypothetical protein
MEAPVSSTSGVTSSPLPSSSSTTTSSSSLSASVVSLEATPPLSSHSSSQPPHAPPAGVLLSSNEPIGMTVSSAHTSVSVLLGNTANIVLQPQPDPASHTVPISTITDECCVRVCLRVRTPISSFLFYLCEKCLATTQLYIMCIVPLSDFCDF